MTSIPQPGPAGLVHRARQVWTDLARVPLAFPPPGQLRVVTSPRSWLCPPSWAGIIALGDAAIATAPDHGLTERLRTALRGLPITRMTEPETVRTLLPVGQVRGPATLSYTDTRRFRPAQVDVPVETLPADHLEVRAVLASAGRTDAEESGIDEITSAAFVVRADAYRATDASQATGSDGRAVLAVAGYRYWPGDVAHVSVLTAVGHRGRGLARAVASAAVTDALAVGLLPQWRARVEPSRRVSRALGFAELGTQLSLQIGE